VVPGLLAALVVAALAGCGDDDDGGATAPTTLPDGFTAERCLVRLHGKSETGAEAQLRDDGVAELAPTGNGRAGEGHEWVYDPDEELDEAVATVADLVEEVGCTRVVLDGFSNGGAFAATVACRGETLDGALVGVVVDDPPPDEGVVDCAPAEGVELALYWTGALDEQAQPGADCDDLGWTCAGGRLLGIDAYAEALGVEAQDSPFDEHRWYRDAPEIDTWLAA
jgi:pimeloyl-ACP methyl ester carboxylesterase